MVDPECHADERMSRVGQVIPWKLYFQGTRDVQEWSKVGSGRRRLCDQARKEGMEDWRTTIWRGIQFPACPVGITSTSCARRTVQG
jgi:hypothetical protein